MEPDESLWQEKIWIQQRDWMEDQDKGRVWVYHENPTEWYPLWYVARRQGAWRLWRRTGTQLAYDYGDFYTWPGDEPPSIEQMDQARLILRLAQD